MLYSGIVCRARQHGARSVKVPFFLPSHKTSAFFDSKECWTMHMSSSCHELMHLELEFGRPKGGLDQPSDHNGLDVIAFGIISWLGALAMGDVGRLAPGHLVPTTCCVAVQVGMLFSRVEPERSCRTDLVWCCVAWACRCCSTVVGDFAPSPPSLPPPFPSHLHQRHLVTSW